MQANCISNRAIAFLWLGILKRTSRRCREPGTAAHRPDAVSEPDVTTAHKQCLPDKPLRIHRALQTVLCHLYPATRPATNSAFPTAFADPAPRTVHPLKPLWDC